MNNRKVRILTWIPRVLTILFALFLSVFSLDVLSEPGDPLLKAAGFLIHLIPTALVFLCLALAWRRPARGGPAFIALGIASVFFCSSWRSAGVFLSISLPLLFIGMLFAIQALPGRSKRTP
jgi:hypothetical protein